MRATVVTILCLLANAFADPPAQEDPILEYDQGVARVTYQAHLGRAYFLQYSTDLHNWRYFPDVIERGDGLEKEWMFSTTADNIFARLVYKNDDSLNPADEDFDHDGYSNFFELQFSNSDPFNSADPAGSLDLDGDGLSDDWEIEKFGSLIENGDGDFDNDGISNSQELLNGTDPLFNDTPSENGGGNGETFEGISSIPSNEETFDFMGEGEEGEREHRSQTVTWEEGASNVVFFIGVYSDEYPNFTEGGSSFNDIVDFRIDPPMDGESRSESFNVNTLHNRFESEGKDFDLGAGEQFYCFKEPFLIQNTERGSISVELEIGATNIGDGGVPSGVTLAGRAVQIQPKAASAGSVGDLILSNKGESGEKHFVSTKKNEHLDTERIEFEVTGIEEELFEEFLEWEGGVAGETILERSVDRAQSKKTVLRVRVKETGDILDLMNVWTVWADLNSSITPAAANRSINPKNGLHTGTFVVTIYECNAKITPASIITDADRPNLTGENVNPAPGGVNVIGFPLGGGAQRKWDMSRRIQRRININADPELQVRGNDRNIDFPKNRLIGNDDAVGGEEVLFGNNPYENGGKLTSGDRPVRGLTLQGGDLSSTYENNTQFQEFARLEINGRWYLISDDDAWSMFWKMKKEIVTEASLSLDVNKDGDLDDDVREIDAGADTNGDGVIEGFVTRWIDNGSRSAN